MGHTVYNIYVYNILYMIHNNILYNIYIYIYMYIYCILHVLLCFLRNFVYRETRFYFNSTESFVG